MSGCLFLPGVCGIGRCWADIKTWVVSWSNNNSKSTLTSFEDRYELGIELGSGNYSVIHECFDKRSNETWACKSIAKKRLVTQDDILNVKLEVDITKRLSAHPNIVNLKEVYGDENYVRLVMELCPGGDLYDHMQKYKSKRLSEFSARRLFQQLLLVVMYCHENGVIHRDLKPENILLATEGSYLPIKLADFGFATYIQPGEKLYGVFGTRYYIAPEVLTGKVYDQTADIWSAGVILYILLIGQVPFWGATEATTLDAVMAAKLSFPSDARDQISASAKHLITKILNPDPRKRLTAPQILDHSWMK
ncbi:calcium-dependent protein kinase 14-like [Papaver somniferum]|uniref:calcium-dependent protein kinase 14-like n=1 Tax=Papaver somniferum TaxID=3469 RepID=UPI000E7039F7|nr:calcium-dependent protein kinase 14-like [Papaver somniferum]